MTIEKDGNFSWKLIQGKEKGEDMPCTIREGRFSPSYSPPMSPSWTAATYPCLLSLASSPHPKISVKNRTPDQISLLTPCKGCTLKEMMDQMVLEHGLLKQSHFSGFTASQNGWGWKVSTEVLGGFLKKYSVPVFEESGESKWWKGIL